MRSVISLRWSAPAELAVVGPVDGLAELAVLDTTARSAIALVDSVVVSEMPDSLRPGGANELATADRDRILAAIYLDRYGARIEATLTCRTCHDPFDLDFRLDELVTHCDPAGAIDPPPWPVQGVELRPVTGVDELAAQGRPDPADALVRRLVGDPPAGDEGLRALIADELSRRTPPVAAPIGASCPACGELAEVEFDIQRYLLGRLLGERAELFRDVHVIASTYHWSRAEILALIPEERRHYGQSIGSMAGSR